MDQLGITKNEFRVYQTLLEQGACTISSLSHKVKLDQRSTYDYIERLLNKGLVGQILVNNKRMFLGLNPDMLGYMIDEEKNISRKQFLELEMLAKESRQDIVVTLISTKAQFLKFIKHIHADVEIVIGGSARIINEPNFRFFLKNNRVKPIGGSEREVIVMFFEDCFLIYSVVEKMGFFVKNNEFAENMKVYFA